MKMYQIVVGATVLMAPSIGVGVTPWTGEGPVIPSCLDCFESFASNHHSTVYDLDLEIGWDGEEHGIESGLCDSDHELVLCFGGEDTEFLDLFPSAATIPTDELVGFVRRHGRRVRVNRDRQALQVYGCDGSQIVAQLPLNHGQLEALADSD